MTERLDFLVELGSEELPPKALLRLRDAFRDELVQGIDEAGLEHGAVHAYATPRRLAVLIEGLATQQPDQAIERRGPALSAAYDAAGNPTKAAEGFARSCGVTMDQLERLETDKGAWLVYRGTRPGQPAKALLPALVGWFARHSAAAAGRSRLNADDVLAGVRTTHHTFGVSPVFSRISECMRLRGISDSGAVLALVTRYGP